MSLLNLPPEIIQLICLNLHIIDIEKICKISPIIKNILESRYFWKQKFNRDYEPIDWEPEDWRDQYIYMAVYMNVVLIQQIIL